MLRFFFRLPWFLLRELLIRTDRDYWRMLAVTGEPHSLDGYWEFVEVRQVMEKSGQHDRTNKLNWDDLGEEEEDFDPEPDEPEFEPEEEPQEKPDPKPRKTALQKAEELLGLESGQYDEKALKRAFAKAMKAAHPDHGGTDEKARAVNHARDVIRRAKGWDK